MGREVRMVPADWQHPKDATGRYIPMLEQSYSDALTQWESEDLVQWREGQALWAEGKAKTYSGDVETIADVVARQRERDPRRQIPDNPPYSWWAGEEPPRPDPADHMPDWSDGERTHFMMYEDTSEGTPISPAFETPEKLARWLADTGASAFGGDGADYEGWLRVARGGWAPSAVISGARIESGVQALSDEP